MHDARQRLNNQGHTSARKTDRLRTEVIENPSFKEELRENLEQVKESVRRVERDIEKLG